MVVENMGEESMVVENMVDESMVAENTEVKITVEESTEGKNMVEESMEVKNMAECMTKMHTMAKGKEPTKEESEPGKGGVPMLVIQSILNTPRIISGEGISTISLDVGIGDFWISDLYL